MSKSYDNEKRTLSGIVTPVVWALGSSFIAILMLGYFTTQQINMSSIKMQKKSLMTEVVTKGNRLMSLVETNAWWQDAFKNIYIKQDFLWAKQMLTGTLDVIGKKSAYILLDAENKIMGQKIDANILDFSNSFLANLAPIANDMVARGDGSPVSKWGLMPCRQSFCVFGISLVIDPSLVIPWPDPDAERQRRPALIFIQYLGAEALSDIAYNQSFNTLEFYGLDRYSPTSTSLPLHDINGALLGYLVWETELPGTAVIKWSSGPLMLVFLFMSLMAYIFYLKASTVTHSLNEALDARSRFLANVSHEIRTPINGFLGMNRLLANTELSREQKDYVEAAEHSALTLSTLLKDILAYSHADSKEMVFETIPIALRELIKKAGLPWKGQCIEKNITLTSTCDSCVPEYVIGDPARLTQVIFNFISNAIKFTNLGKIKIHCAATAITEKTAKIRISVEDSGIGLADTAKKNIFHAFVQADSSTHRKFGGTGLGLAICKKIVDRMGGVIGVDDAEHSGAIFWFEVTMPITTLENSDCKKQAEEHITESQNVILSDNTAGDKSTKPKTCNILVAEDNPINQILLSKILTKQGHKFTLTGNGQEAVDQYHSVSNGEEPYDIILMDIRMPVMNGEDAMLAIRQSNTDIPIIAVTAEPDANGRKDFLDKGFSNIVAKPIDTDVLLSVIKDAVRPF